MNSLHSAQHVINLIVKQSKEKINQNNLVKNMLVPYATTLSEANKNDAVLHAGTQFDQSTQNYFKKQINEERKPKNNIKDTYTFFSVKKTKLDKKENLEFSITKQASPKKALKNFFKTTSFKSNKSQKEVSQNKNAEASAKSTLQIESLKDTFFIQLEDKKEPVPRFIEKEEREINYLREIKNNEFEEKETERKKDEENEEMNTARQRKIAAQLESHLSKPNNHYTYDADGKLMFCSSETSKKAIEKAYPPAIRYEVENEEDYNQFSEKRQNSNRNRNRAYSNLELKRKDKINLNTFRDKGEIFKSSVLKTINLSRISMGNELLDEAQFMKRNDLFNNNHSRQTTSIPFLKMEGCTSFKETATNQCISNKDFPIEESCNNKKESFHEMRDSRAKSHDSRAKKEFKKYCLKRDSLENFNMKLELESGKKAHSNINKTFQKNKSIGDSRYSSFYIQRPHTTEVGRIKRENEVLFHSMLEEN